MTPEELQQIIDRWETGFIEQAAVYKLIAEVRVLHQVKALVAEAIRKEYPQLAKDIWKILDELS